VAFAPNPERQVEILKKQALRFVNYAGSWRHTFTNLRDLTVYDNVNYQLLANLKTLKETHTNIKIRIEESRVQLYAETEDELKSAVQVLDNGSCVRIVTGPKPGTENQLIGDVIIAKQIKYKYKVLFRDGKYRVDNKAKILNLLQSQGDDVNITAGSTHALMRPYEALWGAFFYTNDLAIVTFISLIEPSIVGKIHEIVIDK
jgi:hypothetical protein